MTRLLLALMAALLLAAPLPARAQGADPAQAVRGFFQAVMGASYGEAWSMLTAHSQTQLVDFVARNEKMDPAEVRRLFANNQMQGFWDNWRRQGGVQDVAGRNFSTASVSGTMGKVVADGGSFVFKAFKETGGWRFGLVETFPKAFSGR